VLRGPLVYHDPSSRFLVHSSWWSADDAQASVTRGKASSVLGQGACRTIFAHLPELVITDIRQIRGRFEARIALLSGLSNGE
jgi:siroheme synthase (precorrin-2 oxidase/ferrochelatase)